LSDEVRGRPMPRIRVSASELLADLLPIVVQRPKDSSAGFALDVVVTAERVDLLQREADIAIRHVRPEHQELIARQLGTVPMGVFAHVDYVAEVGELTHETLAQHRFVDTLSHGELVRGAAEIGMSVDAQQVVFRSDCAASRRRAVSAGWGIGAFPLWIGMEHAQWVPVMPHDVVIDAEVWLVGRPEVRDSTQLQQLFTRLGDDLITRLDEMHASLAPVSSVLSSSTPSLCEGEDGAQAIALARTS